MQFRYQPALYSPPHTNVVLSASHIEMTLSPCTVL